MAVEDARLVRGWTGVQMARHIGLPRNTISRLRDSSRTPTVATVHAVADALAQLDVTVNGEKITRKIAEQLAGLRPPSPGQPGHVSVRDAIMAETSYTPDQRDTLLRLVDLVEQANRQRRAS